MSFSFSSILAIAFNLLDSLAAMTETEIDDQTAGVLRKISELPEVKAWLNKLFRSKDAIPVDSLGIASAPERVTLAIERAGFSGADVLKYLPMLLEILAQIRAWRKAQRPTK